ncbi:FadR/GntR family transcriptional regulator [Janibacter sp. GXQ6167]|uniref:FadR/GntR family transcriptional regulator n=1 Tax=Janibacter sp. GXQ6167 TaxID=3240791 RepID=UPI003524435D
MSEAHHTPTPRWPALILQPVTGHPFEHTVEQLATAIRLGAFADGERLPPERDLAALLGVSRMTLRDAIAALREAGLVETKSGRGGGTTVRYEGQPVDPGLRGEVRRGAALEDALAYRRVVEPGAAGLAASRALTRDQRAWLEESRQEVAETSDHGAYRVADARLHLAIATCSGSPMLIEAVTRAQAATHEMLRAIPVLTPNIAHSDEQHAQIVAAILTGDAEGARRAMEEHCDATAALLRGLLG